MVLLELVADLDLLAGLAWSAQVDLAPVVRWVEVPTEAREAREAQVGQRELREAVVPQPVAWVVLAGPVGLLSELRRDGTCL